MIAVNNLSIGYHSSILSIDEMLLKAGEMYFLIGRNGSGKSTFLKTISAQIPPVSGSLKLNEIEINSIPTNEIPKYISFVGAHFPAVDFLKVEDYIALARSPYSNYFGKLSKKDIEIIQKSIEILGIESLKNRFTSELSDGEKQMVAIAKSIAQETEVILLDEPTAFLDYANKKLVIEALSKICSELNKCIILSSHDIDLSLESKGNYLIVDAQKKTISLHNNGLDKIELLKIAF